MVFNLLLLVIYPTFIAPLFNKFKPLEDETLKARVTDCMQRCGFAAKGLFVMDGSKRSAHANAYFTGFGKAKRMVFYDTLLSRLDARRGRSRARARARPFQAQAHREAHRGLFALSLAGFALLGWLSRRLWFYTGPGRAPEPRGPTDALALLLFFLAVPVFISSSAPLFAWFSRKHEFEADAYAVPQTSGRDLPAPC